MAMAGAKPPSATPSPQRLGATRQIGGSPAHDCTFELPQKMIEALHSHSCKRCSLPPEATGEPVAPSSTARAGLRALNPPSSRASQAPAPASVCPPELIHRIHSARTGSSLCFKPFSLPALRLQGFLIARLPPSHTAIFPCRPERLQTIGSANHSIKRATTFKGKAYRFHYNGQLKVLEAKVFREDLRLPLLSAERLYLKFGARAQGKLRLSIYRGTLFQPASYDPMSQRRECLKGLGLDLEIEGEAIRLNTLRANYHSLRILGRAELPRNAPLPASASTKPDSDPLHFFFNQLHDNAAIHALIQKIGEPLLSFQLSPEMPEDSEENSALQLSVQLNGEDLKYDSIELEGINIQGLAVLGPEKVDLKNEIHFEAQKLSLNKYDITIEAPSGRIKVEDALALSAGDWPACRIIAEKITGFEKEVHSAALQIRPTSPDAVELIAYAQGFGGRIAFNGSLNHKDYSGHGELEGAVYPNELLPSQTTQSLPQLEIAKPSHCKMQLSWAADFKRPRAHTFAHFIQPAINGVGFEVASLNAMFDPDHLEINPLRFKRDDQWVELSYIQDFKKNSYALSTQGRLIPDQYNPFMPRWWKNIFNEDFVFNEGSRVEGDCVVYGDTRKFTTNFYYGRFDASDLLYRKVPLDHGELTLRGRNRNTQIHKLHVQSGNNWAKGDIHFTGYPDEIRASAAIRYDLEGQLPLNNLRSLLPPETAKNLAPFQSAHAPYLRFQAAQFREKDYPQFKGLSNIQLEVDADAPLIFNKLELEHLRFKLHARGPRLSLRQLDFGMAAGIGTGEIDRLKSDADSTPWLRLNLQLDHADYHKARAILAKFQNKEPKEATAEASAPEYTGVLDLNLHSEGPADDLDQQSGFGHFFLEHENLATIQLLGPLSMILEKTPLGFTSLKLNQMQSEFALAGGYLKFSPLNILGPQTSIEANGTLKLSDQALDMFVSVNLIGNLSEKINPFKRITNVINPLNYLMQFRVSGTLDNQSIRSIYDPRNLIPRGMN
jgi:hypothetical protein